MTGLKILAAGTETAGKTCSICQTAIILGEHIVYCPDCELPLHHECWNENGGCSAYGCPSAPQTVKPESAQGVANPTVWGSEKPCPACGREIKAQALKCRFCGATFDSRDLITRDEYGQREYEGKEYASTRNKIIGLFLASISGCLTPIAVILLAILVFRKKLFGMEYRRLPAALRGMVLSGVGIGSLLILLLLYFAILD